MIELCDFPDKWKQACIAPIQSWIVLKITMIFDQFLYCLFCLKSTRGLFTTKLMSFLENHHLLEDNISEFRKSHSTTSVLLSIQDDILKAMNRSECTLLVLADFSKGFDTVK